MTRKKQTMEKQTMLENEKQSEIATHTEKRALYGIKSVEDATKPLRFFIMKKHIKDATCGDPQKCVIAQALLEAVPLLSDVEVGSSVTKVIIGDKCIRYATPPRLRIALRIFDVTGNWKLPEGTYVLAPTTAGRTKLVKNDTKENRERKKKRWQEHTQKLKNGETTGKGISVFKSRSLLTRRVAIVKEIPLNE